jgi:hypothetical protein
MDLMDWFYGGLSKEVKNFLIIMHMNSKPQTLDALIINAL